MPLSEVRTGIRRYAGVEGRPSSGRRSGGFAKFFALLQIPFSLAALGLIAALILRGPDSLLFLHGLLAGDKSGFSLVEPKSAQADPGMMSAPDSAPNSAPGMGRPLPATNLAPLSVVEEATPATPRLEAAVLVDPGRPTLKDFDRRWRKDRHNTVIVELAEHPPSITEQIVAKQPRLMVISAHQGAPKAVYTSAAGPDSSNYGGYLEQKLGEVGTIVVEVSAREPTVIFATATRAVDWRFVFAEDAQVLAVHVEGAMAPTVTGVPRDVPLTVNSRAFGDHNAAGRVRTLGETDPDDASTREIRANLARFNEMYAGLPMTIFEKHTLARVSLIDETAEGDREAN